MKHEFVPFHLCALIFIPHNSTWHTYILGLHIKQYIQHSQHTYIDTLIQEYNTLKARHPKSTFTSQHNDIYQRLKRRIPGNSSLLPHIYHNNTLHTEDKPIADICTTHWQHTFDTKSIDDSLLQEN
mgnify:CR=1 FL=1